MLQKNFLNFCSCKVAHILLNFTKLIYYNSWIHNNYLFPIKQCMDEGFTIPSKRSASLWLLRFMVQGFTIATAFVRYLRSRPIASLCVPVLPPSHPELYVPKKKSHLRMPIPPQPQDKPSNPWDSNPHPSFRWWLPLPCIYIITQFWGKVY